MFGLVIPSDGCSNPASPIALKSSGRKKKSLNPVVLNPSPLFSDYSIFIFGQYLLSFPVTLPLVFLSSFSSSVEKMSSCSSSTPVFFIVVDSVERFYKI